MSVSGFVSTAGVIIFVDIQTLQAQTAVGFQAMTIAMIAMADDGGPNYATRRKQNAYNKTENDRQLSVHIGK